MTSVTLAQLQAKISAYLTENPEHADLEVLCPFDNWADDPFYGNVELAPGGEYLRIT